MAKFVIISDKPHEYDDFLVEAMEAMDAVEVKGMAIVLLGENKAAVAAYQLNGLGLASAKEILEQAAMTQMQKEVNELMSSMSSPEEGD